MKTMDIIRDSKELKKEIRSRLKKIKTPLITVCEDSKTDYKSFKRFMNTENPQNDNNRIKQSDIINVCDYLDIGIKVLIILKPLKPEKHGSTIKDHEEESSGSDTVSE